jgi:hypothetical protein
MIQFDFRCPLATFDIDGIHLAVVLKRSCTKLKVTLDNLAMFSCVPDSLYSQVSNSGNALACHEGGAGFDAHHGRTFVLVF